MFAEAKLEGVPIPLYLYIGGVPGKWNFQLQCDRQGKVSWKEASSGEGT